MGSIRTFAENRKSDLRFAKFFMKAAYGVGYELRPGQKLSPGLVLERHAEERPNHPGLLYEDRRYSYAEYNAQVNHAAHALSSIGVARGDVIALMMDNRPEFLFTVLGANKIGAVVSLINTYVTGKQLEHVLTICHPKWVVAGSEHSATVAALGDKLPVPTDRLVVWADQGGAALAGAVDFGAEFDRASSENPSDTGDNDITDTCVYIYTSGTTGYPKAAPYTNRRALQSGWVFGRAAIGITPDDVIYSSGLPLYHSSGLNLATFSALNSGATLALRRKFSVSKHWDDCDKFGVTLFVYIGELCRYLYNSKPHPKEASHKVRAIFGAGIRPDFWDGFSSRFRIKRIFEIYGATEAPIGLINLESVPGMVGRMMPGQMLVRTEPESTEPIRDADGKVIPCKEGQTGLLIGRITKVNQFDGYLDKAKNNDKLILNAFGEGKHAFNTGDLLRLNARKYLSFEDRLGDTFRWKGENVATNEVGAILTACDGVVEANVYGVKVPGTDGRAGMTALVPGQGFSLDALGAHVANELPSFARPIFLRLEKSMQVTATFKYVKTNFKEQGFSPDKCPSPLYLLREDRYVPLTAELHQAIVSGKIRL